MRFHRKNEKEKGRVDRKNNKDFVLFVMGRSIGNVNDKKNGPSHNERV